MIKAVLKPLFLSLSQSIQGSLRWYERNAMYVMPFGLLIIVSFVIQHIPYINLQAPLFSSLFLFIPIFFFVIKRQWHTQTILFIFIFLIVCSFLLSSFQFRFQAESFGTVFYLLLICVTLKYIYEEIRTE